MENFIIYDADSKSRFLSLEPNKNSWQDIIDIDDPLYVELHNYNNDFWMTMSYENMVDLRNWLSDKIEFLNNKEEL
mgnify:CR=1 FL=1